MLIWSKRFKLHKLSQALFTNAWSLGNWTVLCSSVSEDNCGIGERGNWCLESGRLDHRMPASLHYMRAAILSKAELLFHAGWLLHRSLCLWEAFWQSGSSLFGWKNGTIYISPAAVVATQLLKLTKCCCTNWILIHVNQRSQFLHYKAQSVFVLSGFPPIAMWKPQSAWSSTSSTYLSQFAMKFVYYTFAYLAMIKACYLHNHMHPTFPTLHCMISHSSLVIPNIWWIIDTYSNIRLCVTQFFSFFNNYLFQKGGRIHYLVSNCHACNQL